MPPFSIHIRSIHKWNTTLCTPPSCVAHHLVQPNESYSNWTSVYICPCLAQLKKPTEMENGLQVSHTTLKSSNSAWDLKNKWFSWAYLTYLTYMRTKGPFSCNIFVLTWEIKSNNLSCFETLLNHDCILSIWIQNNIDLTDGYVPHCWRRITAFQRDLYCGAELVKSFYSWIRWWKISVHCMWVK